MCSGGKGTLHHHTRQEASANGIMSPMRTDLNIRLYTLIRPHIILNTVHCPIKFHMVMPNILQSLTACNAIVFKKNSSLKLSPSGHYLNSPTSSCSSLLYSVCLSVCMYVCMYVRLYVRLSAILFSLSTFSNLSFPI